MTTDTKQRLDSVFTGIAAPRPGGKTRINIDIGKLTATFHCSREEHEHTGDDVDFCADADCELDFDNPAVFGTGQVQLSNGQPTRLSVRNNNVETHCWITVDRPIFAIKNDPKIVVP